MTTIFAKIYLEAADMIESKDLCKGHFFEGPHDNPTAICMVEAVYRCSMRYGHPLDNNGCGSISNLASLLSVPEGCPAGWSDSHSKEEVITRLREIAQRISK